MTCKAAPQARQRNSLLEGTLAVEEQAQRGHGRAFQHVRVVARVVHAAGRVHVVVHEKGEVMKCFGDKPTALSKNIKVKHERSQQLQWSCHLFFVSWCSPSMSPVVPRAGSLPAVVPAAGLGRSDEGSPRQALISLRTSAGVLILWKSCESKIIKSKN